MTDGLDCSEVSVKTGANAVVAALLDHGLKTLYCLHGQIPSHAIGKGLGYLHELPDQLGPAVDRCVPSPDPWVVDLVAVPARHRNAIGHRDL
jgi:hypothetical protein